MEKRNVPKLRFPGFEGEWEECRLSNVLEEHLKKNSGNSHLEVFSVAKSKGVINQIEHLGKSFAAESIEHYKLAFPYDVIYTKSPTADFPYGIVKQNLTGRTGVVSPLYGVFKPKNQFIGSLIHSYFLSGIRAYNYLNPIVQKGAKNTINVSNKDFLNGSQFYFPKSETEQQKIVDFIATAHNSIHLLQQQKHLLENYKKGMMQRLFSQEIRFKQDDSSDFPEWEERKIGDVFKLESRPVNKPNASYLAIGVRSHFKGTFHKPDSDPEKIAMDVLFEVKENDLIVNITFAWEGAVTIAKPEDEGGLVSHRFPTYVNDKNKLDIHFFGFSYMNDKFKATLELISPGGAGRNRVLKKDDFLKIDFMLPSLPEQTKIANFLSAIDEKIALCGAQLEKAEEWKKGLLQQLFV